MLCVDFNYEDCCGGVVHLDGGGGSLAGQLVGIGVVVDIGWRCVICVVGGLRGFAAGFVGGGKGWVSLSGFRSGFVGGVHRRDAVSWVRRVE